MVRDGEVIQRQNFCHHGDTISLPKLGYVTTKLNGTNEISEIQESIDEAAYWTSMNCMKINTKKSKEMIISFTQDVNFRKCVPNIVIEGIPVEVVKHAKLLGVILSDDLTWNMQVDSIVKKSC